MCCGALWASELERGFFEPPDSARPWVYGFWINGNINSNGITADLEAMQRVGIGGLTLMDVDVKKGAPKGPAGFGTPAWRALFKHLCGEAHRLGLEVNMHNGPGWTGSGGPWITPELAMQKVVWTETVVSGPDHLDTALAQPETVWNFYRDIAVLAFPAPAGNSHLRALQAKTLLEVKPVVTHAVWPSLAADQVIVRNRIIDLTSRVKTNGHLVWEIPEGRWTILRIGHTPTGKDCHPAQAEGIGPECDKLSKAAAEVMFKGMMGKLVADVGPLVGKTLVSTHIDSWEIGSQNWTPLFPAEFQARRGYDLRAFLPVITGRVVDSLEISERFLWDFRQTISELLLDNYAEYYRELAHRHGLRLSIEGYSVCPTDEMAYAGRADEPMGEVWTRGKFGMSFACTETASAAHVYGKQIVSAEIFTTTTQEKWLDYPGAALVKEVGDWAFCEGINRFVIHRYPMQPWRDARPGMSMGATGTHYERTRPGGNSPKPSTRTWRAASGCCSKAGRWPTSACWEPKGRRRPCSTGQLFGPTWCAGLVASRAGSELQLRCLPAGSGVNAHDGRAWTHRAVGRHELPAVGPAAGRDDDAATAAQGQ